MALRSRFKLSRKCQGILYPVLIRTSSNHPCSPSQWSLNLHLLLAMSPYLTRAVSCLSRTIAGLPSLIASRRSPISILSVHVTDNYQVLFEESHIFLTLQPLHLIIYNARFIVYIFFHNHTNPVLAHEVRRHAAGTADATEITNFGISVNGWQPMNHWRYYRRESRRGDH